MKSPSKEPRLTEVAFIRGAPEAVTDGANLTETRRGALCRWRDQTFSALVPPNPFDPAAAQWAQRGALQPENEDARQRTSPKLLMAHVVTPV
jgi:hypothetical protein